MTPCQHQWQLVWHRDILFILLILHQRLTLHCVCVCEYRLHLLPPECWGQQRSFTTLFLPTRLNEGTFGEIRLKQTFLCVVIRLITGAQFLLQVWCCYLRQGGYVSAPVCLFVWVSAGLHKYYRTDFHETCLKVGTRAKKNQLNVGAAPGALCYIWQFPRFPRK